MTMLRAIPKTLTPFDKIKIIEDYRNSHSRAQFLEIISGLINEKTINAWIKDPLKIIRANKSKEIDRIIEKIPNEKHVDHINNYQFSLREMHEDVESQNKLLMYEGRYEIFHNIPTNCVRFNVVSIKINNNPFFPVFAFPIRLSGSRSSKKNDGFVFLKGDYVIMTGLSEYINSFFIFSRVVNIQNDLMEGLITIHDAANNKAYTSSAIMKHMSYKGENGKKDDRDKWIMERLKKVSEEI